MMTIVTMIDGNAYDKGADNNTINDIDITPSVKKNEINIFFFKDKSPTKRN